MEKVGAVESAQGKKSHQNSEEFREPKVET